MFHFTIPDNLHAPCTTICYCYYCISICARSQFCICIQWIFPNHNILCWFTIMLGILTSQQLIEETLQGAWVSFKVGKPQHCWKTLLPPQGAQHVKRPGRADPQVWLLERDVLSGRAFLRSSRSVLRLLLLLCGSGSRVVFNELVQPVKISSEKKMDIFQLGEVSQDT